MQVLTSLLALIVVARLMGHLFARMRQPVVVGEMLAGVLLGPALLGLVQPTEALAGVSALAVFLVILSAGLEMSFREVMSAMRGRGLVIALLGFALPFAGGVGVAQAFGLDIMRTVFLGLCVAITALPVAVKILDDLGLLNTAIARHAISTAVLNDVVALFVLGIVLGLPAQSSWAEVVSASSMAMVKLAALIALVLALNLALLRLDRLGVNIAALPERLVAFFGPDALFGLVVVFVLVFGSFTEALGFHFVIGAFFAALLLDERHFMPRRFEDLKHTLASVTNGFLAPVFFATLGLEFTFDAVLNGPGFAAAVLAVSVATKMAAGWWGGLLCGMSRREALGLGCVLNGRGVMELVVASIAYERGFIDQGLFSVLVLMGIVTTLLTPVMFNAVVSPRQRADYIETGRLP
jgi:Kef-type K+ transport system membrane component KefB